jgi:hypothetical protein
MSAEISNSQAAATLATDLQGFAHLMRDLRFKVLEAVDDELAAALVVVLEDRAEYLSGYADCLCKSISADERRAAA